MINAIVVLTILSCFFLSFMQLGIPSLVFGLKGFVIFGFFIIAIVLLVLLAIAFNINQASYKRDKQHKELMSLLEKEQIDKHEAKAEYNNNPRVVGGWVNPDA